MMTKPTEITTRAKMICPPITTTIEGTDIRTRDEETLQISEDIITKDNLVLTQERISTTNTTRNTEDLEARLKVMTSITRLATEAQDTQGTDTNLDIMPLTELRVN